MYDFLSEIFKYHQINQICDKRVKYKKSWQISYKDAQINKKKKMELHNELVVFVNIFQSPISNTADRRARK